MAEETPDRWVGATKAATAAKYERIEETMGETEAEETPDSRVGAA